MQIPSINNMTLIINEQKLRSMFWKPIEPNTHNMTLLLAITQTKNVVAKFVPF